MIPNSKLWQFGRLEIVYCQRLDAFLWLLRRFEGNMSYVLKYKKQLYMKCLDNSSVIYSTPGAVKLC